MEAIFQPEDSLQETAAYRQLLSVAALGRPQIHNGVRLSTPELIRNYFKHYRDLKLSIEKHGFLQRRQVSREISSAFAHNMVRSSKAELQEREVSIAISADGEPIRIVGGHHRTAIAQRIGLTRMPVQVRLVHAKWLARQIQQTRLSPAQALIVGIRKLSFFLIVSTSLHKHHIDELCLSGSALV
jgi:hypothetical protein